MSVSFMIVLVEVFGEKQGKTWKYNVFLALWGASWRFSSSFASRSVSSGPALSQEWWITALFVPWVTPSLSRHCKQIKTMPASTNYRQCLPQSRPLHIKDFSTWSQAQNRSNHIVALRDPFNVPTTFWIQEIHSTSFNGSNSALSWSSSETNFLSPRRLGPFGHPPGCHFRVSFVGAWKTRRKSRWGNHRDFSLHKLP